MSEQQVLSHKKRDYIKGFSFDAESIQNPRDEPGAFPGVIFPISLPDIVKEGGQKKPMRIFQFFKRLSEQRPFFIISTLWNLIHDLKGPQRVEINSLHMIITWLRQIPYPFKFGNKKGDQSDLKGKPDNFLVFRVKDNFQK